MGCRSSLVSMHHQGAHPSSHAGGWWRQHSGIGDDTGVQSEQEPRQQHGGGRSIASTTQQRLAWGAVHLSGRARLRIWGSRDGMQRQVLPRGGSAAEGTGGSSSGCGSGGFRMKRAG